MYVSAPLDQNMRTDIVLHLVILLFKNRKSTELGQNKKRDSSPIGQKQEQRLYANCQNMRTVIVRHLSKYI